MRRRRETRTRAGGTQGRSSDRAQTLDEYQRAYFTAPLSLRPLQKYVLIAHVCVCVCVDTPRLDDFFFFSNKLVLFNDRDFPSYVLSNCHHLLWKRPLAASSSFTPSPSLLHSHLPFIISHYFLFQVCLHKCPRGRPSPESCLHFFLILFYRFPAGRPLSLTQ